MSASSSSGAGSSQPQPQPASSSTGGLQAAMADWKKCVTEWYPDLLNQTHFCPPMRFNRVSYGVEVIADQPVLKPQTASAQPPAGPAPLYPPRRCPPPTAGPMWTTPRSDPASLLPVPNSAVRDDTAMNLVLQCLQRLAQPTEDQDEDQGEDQAEAQLVENGGDQGRDQMGGKTRDQGGDLTGEVMMVVSELEFQKYLDGQTSPVQRAAFAPLPRAADLDQKHRNGEFDVLVIHRHYGVLVGEVKSVGADLTNVPDLNKALDKRVGGALKQLGKSVHVLRHLMSDLGPVRVTAVLMLPNISLDQLHAALSASPTTLAQELCRITGREVLTEAAQSVMTQDVLSQPSSWWQDTLRSAGPDPCMTDKLYLSLVARFCGPATSVEVWCPTAPRAAIRTLGQAVAETGARFATLALTPNQLQLLNNRSLGCVHLQGPPGCGKTVVLALRAMQWLKEGHHVHVLSLRPDHRAVVQLIAEQLAKSQRAISQQGVHKVHVHNYDFRDSPADVVAAMADLLAAAQGDKLHVIVDEVTGSVRVRWIELLNGLFRGPLSLCAWSAGVYRVDDESLSPRLPGWLKVETLTTSLRSPPSVLKEVLESGFIDGSRIPRYTPAPHPSPSEGRVTILRHRFQRGHAGKSASRCALCADRVAAILNDKLRVGQPDCGITWEDVVVLYGGDNPDKDDAFIQQLEKKLPKKEDHTVPLTVMPRPLSDSQCNALGLAKTEGNMVVTQYQSVPGLERKVVIGLGAGGADWGYRAHLMSRCTAFLVFIDPDRSDKDDSDINCRLLIICSIIVLLVCAVVFFVFFY